MWNIHLLIMFIPDLLWAFFIKESEIRKPRFLRDSLKMDLTINGSNNKEGDCKNEYSAAGR